MADSTKVKHQSFGCLTPQSIIHNVQPYLKDSKHAIVILMDENDECLIFGDAAAKQKEFALAAIKLLALANSEKIVEE